MSKNLNLFLFFCVITVSAQAQWSQKDSLNLRRLLQGDGEIKLNPNAVKDIDFGSFIGEPMKSNDSPATRYNTTLPSPRPDYSKMNLTLRPYSIHTKFNYDPIYKRKIKVGPDTWKGIDTLYHLYMHTIYTNWASKPLQGGFRKSLEEIEATGLRYNPIGERVNGMTVGMWQGTPGTAVGTIAPISDKVTTMPGKTTVGSLDLMKPFTRDFWDKRGRENREKTLKLLKDY